MYIESIAIKNFRTFRDVTVEFSHRDRKPSKNFPTPKLPNVNLLLGNNGLGKTTLLKAIALTALGPAVSDSGIYPYRLIRREPNHNTEIEGVAGIRANFHPHPQDKVAVDIVESDITISQRGDIEQLRWVHEDEKTWHPIYSASSDAFFFVGYGATRRVEKQDRADIAGRKQSSFARAQRV